MSFQNARLIMNWETKIDIGDSGVKYVTCCGKTDGLGSQAISYISTMLHARLRGKVYAHTPFRKISRLDSPQKAEEFFNFGYGELSASNITGKIEAIGDAFEKGDRLSYHYHSIIPSLQKKYYSTAKPQCRHFDTNKINVAIHIRRGDVTREKHPNRYTENSKILALQKQIAALPFDFGFHIFSQGSTDDFIEFKGVELHIEENLFETFHHLVKADVLIMAKSSLSYVAALLSDGIKLYDPAHHGKLSDWISVQDKTVSSVLEKMLVETTSF